MTYRQLDDNLNLWLQELSVLENDFHNQASTINSWDSLLVNNAVKITAINETIEKLKADQLKIDHQLDFIISQQNELDTLLQPLEACSIDTSSDPVTSEREATFKMVESIHNDMSGIGSDLQSFIRKLNEMSNTSGQLSDPSDPLVAINKVLNSHMDALQYIDNQVQNIKRGLTTS